MSKWYERFPRRLAAEKIIMKESFPQFVLKMDERKRLFWEGILKTNFETLYRVNIFYPQGYPWDKPKLKVIEPSIRPNAPHRFVDSTLCVFPENWDHKKCTAPAAVPMIASWLALYEVFLRTGKRW